MSSDAMSDDPGAPSSLPALESAVDLRRTRLETLVKILDVDGVVERVPGGVVRTGAPWVYDRERVGSETRLTGPIPARLPVGVDFIARPFGEPMLFRIAAAYEAATKHRRPPEDFGPLK